jgi:peptidoglycan/LPS O-acetylase OafA/YrhL
MKLPFPLTHKTALHYRPDIDGLRAIAILLVVVFHALPTALPSGFIGVDIFFVISGYLITGIILKDMATGHFSYLHFYARRFRRIMPALATVLLSVLLLGWLMLLSDEFSALARNAVAGATFTTNLILLRQASYFDWAAELNPLLHLWSLGVEEQFYLLWPPILLLIHRYSSKWFFNILMLGLVSFGLNAYFISGNETKVFYLLPTRFWELLIGGMLAQYENTHPHATRQHGNTLSVIGLGILFVAIYFINRGESYPGWWAILPTLSALLLIAAGPHTLINRTLLANKPMVLIGLISYPLYLWHWPLLSLARINEGELSFAFALGILGLSAVLAFLTWQFIELPAQLRFFSHHHKKQRDKIYIAYALGSIFLISLLGILIVYKDGYPNRYPEIEAARIKLEQNAAFNISESDDCKQKYGLQISDCFQSSNSPSLALIGDSHARHLYNGMKEEGIGAGTNVLYLGHGGCPPLMDVDTIQYGRDHDKTCALVTEEYTRLFSSKAAQIKTVILASRGPSYISGNDYGDGRRRWDLVALTNQDQNISNGNLFLTGTKRMIDFLESKGMRVILFFDNPELGFRPSTCMLKRPLQLSDIRQACAMPASVVNTRQAEYRKIIERLKVQHPKLEVFDSTNYLCNPEECPVSKDGLLLYVDQDHFSNLGSQYIASKFYSWLEK